jgi:hypothetical protein
MDRLEHTGMTAAGADRGDFLHGLPVDYAKSNLYIGNPREVVRFSTFP